jgi:hypothetical protein
MALTTELMTDQGDIRPVYIRLNSFDQVANHGVTAIARFRAFASKDAFEAGSSFLWERLVEFAADHRDEAPSLWSQAYVALRATDFATEARSKCANLEGEVLQIKSHLAAMAEQDGAAGELGTSDADIQVREAARVGFEEQLERLEAQRPELAAELERHRNTAAAIAASTPA